MAEKFQNKYRVPPARAQWWDYSNAAPYFITICTAGMHHNFGEIINGKMETSAIGKIVQAEWLKTFEMRQDMNLEMGEFIVMPNHFHAILVIGNNKFNDRPIEENEPGKFGAQSKNLAAIVRGFKSGVTKNAIKIYPAFAWQSSYHEHIIRTPESYTNISNYIVNNPEKWEEDRFYS